MQKWHIFSERPILEGGEKFEMWWPYKEEWTEHPDSVGLFYVYTSIVHVAAAKWGIAGARNGELDMFSCTIYPEDGYMNINGDNIRWELVDGGF
jgi:hypothetical protein